MVRAKKVCDQRISQSIYSESAFLADFNQARIFQNPEMLGGVRNAHGCLFGERLDRPFRLREEIEEFKSLRACEGTADFGQRAVASILKSSFSCVDWVHIQIFY